MTSVAEPIAEYVFAPNLTLLANNGVRRPASAASRHRRKGRTLSNIETTELYNGDIICEFNPGRHSYTIVNRGRRYKVPSVTRITSVLDKSGPLVHWAIGNTLEVCKGAIAPGTEYAETYLEAVWTAAKGASAGLKTEAARKGTDRHKELQSRLEETNQIPTGSEWGRLSGLRVVACERRIYSRRYRFSGTFDALLFDGESYILVDWKTSKHIYPEFRLQTAAYVHAYEEEFPDQKIEGRYLVRIAEDGSIEPHFYPRQTVRLDFAAFLGAKALYDRVQTIEKEMRKSLKTKSK